jgi:hypothetical protein
MDDGQAPTKKSGSDFAGTLPKPSVTMSDDRSIARLLLLAIVLVLNDFGR